MKLVNELEQTLLDQIEKLNDDSLYEDEAATALAIQKSKAIADLAQQVVSINRLKLDIVHEAANNGGIYEKVLGIDDAQ